MQPGIVQRDMIQFTGNNHEGIRMLGLQPATAFQMHLLRWWDVQTKVDPMTEPPGQIVG